MNQRTDTPLTSQSAKRGELARKLLAAAKRQRRSRLPLPSMLCDDHKAMPPTLAKVLGPYRNGDKWRLVIKEGDTRKSLVYATEEEALTVRRDLLTALDERGSRTIGDAVEDYLTQKRHKGCLEQSLRTCRDRLLKFLPADDALSAITPDRAETLYLAETEKFAVATHHKSLREAKAFFTFCVKQRSVSVNPFVSVQPIGKAKAGKPQLRQDEAKKLSDLLIDCAANGETPALGLLVQVLLGLRSAEVLKLRKRDLDCGGTVLVIEGTKTRNARRTLSLESPIARDLLARRVANLSPDALIFAPDDRDRPLPTDHLYKALTKYCKRAGVPDVCPHSLRGLHGSLAVQAGATSAYVAQALGHANDTVTRKHYITASALDSARGVKVAAALIGDGDLDSVIASLRTLPQAHLDRVCVALGYRR